MLKTIIEKELKDIIGSSKFVTTFAMSSLLIIFSFYIGARNYQVSTERYEASKKENVRKLEGITDWVMVRDYRVFLPPQPITSIVMGVSNDIGRTADIQGRGEINAEDNRYGDDPVFAVFRFLDLDFIFQIILSLFAILFGYDAINGEKERGTLKLTFANGVPRATFILGKMLGSVFGLGVPLLIPMLIGGLVLIAMGIPLLPEDWIRLALINAAGLLYFVTFLSLSIFVSSMTQRSSTSFLVLLAVWVLGVMVWPRASVLIAGRAVDVPAVDELNVQKAKFNRQLWEEDRKKMSDFRAPTNTPPQEMMQEFQKFMGDLGDQRQKKNDEFVARLNEERSNKQRVQERLSLALARLSPSATVSLLNMSIAGTGIEMKEAFKRSAESYQISYAEFMKQKTGMNVGGGFVVRISTDDDEEKVPIDANEIPPFMFDVPSLRESAGSIAIDFGILIAYTLLFFAGSFVAFLRYDVR